VKLKVGFWATGLTGGKLWEIARDTAIASASGLPSATASVDVYWSGPERDAVIAYVTNRARMGTRYMGYHICRICGTKQGNADFSDSAYVWPEGFGHYIVSHGVKPPDHFIEHVLRRRR